jgi:hypothetical protein
LLPDACLTKASLACEKQFTRIDLKCHEKPLLAFDWQIHIFELNYLNEGMYHAKAHTGTVIRYTYPKSRNPKTSTGENYTHRQLMKTVLVIDSKELSTT